MGDRTKAVHGYEPLEDPYESVVPPVYLGVAYRYVDDQDSLHDERGLDIKYSRENSPTVRLLEKAMTSLEHAVDSLAFSTGMAAISTVLLSSIRRGSRVLLLKEMYSTTVQLTEELASIVGAQVVKVYPSTEAVEEELSSSKYDLVLLETMTNPTLKILDLARLSRVFAESNAKVYVDNTFVTPVLLKPLEYGAWAVIHSITKYIGGHNDVTGGLVALRDTEETKTLWEWRRKLGTIMPPFEAYLTLRGLKTLVPRVELQSRTALALAEFLEGHSKVDTVYYPGLRSSPYHEVASRLFKRGLYGGVLSFKVKGGLDAARRLLRSLRLAKPAPSLGGSETLVTLPALTAASKLSEEDRRELGIDASLVRMSVGLEDPEDLIDDLDRALAQLA